MKKRNVAILIFDDVEVLDFAGPFEVFSVTGKRDGSDPFNCYTVAQKAPVIARNNLSVNPHHLLASCPDPDIIVVPGGGGYHGDGTPFGTRREMYDQTVLAWLRKYHSRAEVTLSVCTGALVLASAGLTRGLDATTHHGAFGALRETDPSPEVYENRRVVESGKFVFSGGISAGIDASFYLVAKLLGVVAAQETAAYMEYDWRP